MTSIITKKARGRFRSLSLSAMICAAVGLTAIKAFAFNDEVMPVYPGGEQALMQDVAAALEYPAAAYEEGIEGRVIVTFVIDTLGRVTRPKVMRGVRADVDSAAVSAIMQLKPFTPGMRGDKPLNVNYTIPVRFKINVPVEPAPAPEPQQPAEQAASNEDGDSIAKLSECDVAPEYPGGDKALARQISRLLKYPENARINHIEGRVIVTFTVDTLGNIKRPRVVRGVCPDLDNEALRVVKLLKEFRPAKKKGRKVSVHYALPINFRLREPIIDSEEKYQNIRSGMGRNPEW